MRDEKGRILKGTTGKEHPMYGKCGVRGEKNHNWSGGKYRHHTGYVYILSRNHPKGRYVSEHVLVVEKNIGRILNHNEHVHHINGIRDDNRIENLIVMTKREHHILHGKMSNVLPMQNKCRELISKGLWHKKPRTSVETKCKMCDNTFLVIQSLIGKKHFCCRSCYLINHAKKAGA